MKTSKTDPNPDPCLGVFCTHATDPKKERIECHIGEGGCSPKLLTAEISKFHDETMQKATAKINRIIASIPPDPQGRKPSLLASKRGILLAWVHHGKAPKGNYSVTADSDDATLIKGLKLKV